MTTFPPCQNKVMIKAILDTLPGVKIFNRFLLLFYKCLTAYLSERLTKTKIIFVFSLRLTCTRIHWSGWLTKLAKHSLYERACQKFTGDHIYLIYL